MERERGCVLRSAPATLLPAKAATRVPSNNRPGSETPPGKLTGGRTLTPPIPQGGQALTPRSEGVCQWRVLTEFAKRHLDLQHAAREGELITGNLDSEAVADMSCQCIACSGEAPTC